VSAVADAPRSQWLGAIGWIVFALLSFLIAAHGISYVFGAEAPPPVIDNSMGMDVLMVHAGASGVALLLGPLQFIAAIRRRAPVVHRWIGRVYMLACIVGGFVGGVLALGASSGPIAVSGFFFLALAWLIATGMGWRAALKRDFATHKRWMIRSFALTFAAVTLRLYLLPAVLMDMGQAYQYIAWAAWVPNLLVVETWIAKRGRVMAAA
jgi:hypothetical protein